MTTHPLLVSKALRPFLFTAGTLFFLIGAIGVVLPLLPTTPFMLLAVWCFARSSRRFHDWLWGHAVFGPAVQNWERHGVIAPRAKILALSMMALSLFYMAFFTNIPVPGLIAASLCLAGSALFVGTRASRPPAGDED